MKDHFDVIIYSILVGESVSLLAFPKRHQASSIRHIYDLCKNIKSAVYRFVIDIENVILKRGSVNVNFSDNIVLIFFIKIIFLYLREKSKTTMLYY